MAITPTMDEYISLYGEALYASSKTEQPTSRTKDVTPQRAAGAADEPLNPASKTMPLGSPVADDKGFIDQVYEARRGRIGTVSKTNISAMERRKGKIADTIDLAQKPNPAEFALLSFWPDPGCWVSSDEVGGTNEEEKVTQMKMRASSKAKSHI